MIIQANILVLCNTNTEYADRLGGVYQILGYNTEDILVRNVQLTSENLRSHESLKIRCKIWGCHNVVVGNSILMNLLEPEDDGSMIC
jgi:hypothetical protein